jgi:hypothetical protein
MAEDFGWVSGMCRIWAYQKRLIWRGENRAGDPAGWPAVSIAGKVREEVDGAAQNKRVLHYPEVLSGEALLVQRAIHGMPFRPSLVLHMHYIARGTVAEKAAFTGVSKARYWTLLDIAHSRIAGFVAAQDQAEWRKGV